MRTVIVGVGNPDRGDDAVGWRVVELLEGSVESCVSAGEPAALVEAFRDHDRVVIVDASLTGATPGTIAVGQPGAGASPGATSSHGLGVEAAIELGRALDVLPAELTIVAVEGRCFDHGSPLSPEVESAAQEVATALRTGSLPVSSNARSGQSPQ